MTLAYTAGAAGLLLAGQQGAQQLAAALNGDGPSIAEVLGTAERVVGDGLDIGQAALVIAFVPVVLRLLQMATPFTETMNMIWRKHALGEHHHPPGPPDNPPGPGPDLSSGRK